MMGVCVGRLVVGWSQPVMKKAWLAKLVEIQQRFHCQVLPLVFYTLRIGPLVFVFVFVFYSQFLLWVEGGKEGG